MKYNNTWLLEKHNAGEHIKFLFFWGHQPAKDGSITKTCFSQWWVAPFEVDDIVYQTAEHWMMAGKARLFNDNAALEQVLISKSPAAAKKAGRMVKGFEPGAWDKQKFDLVVEGNNYKFSQHPVLKGFLLNTNDRVLVEASPVDSIWGIGMAGDHPMAENPAAWKGQNLLGYALMEVRDKLKKSK